jgi:hypothetical protein
MLQKLCLLSKRMMQAAIWEVVFFISLFVGLAVLTLLAAFLMLTEWHCSILTVVMICFVPWVVLICITGIVTLITRHKLQQSRRNFFTFDSPMLTKLVSFALDYYFAKKR